MSQDVVQQKVVIGVVGEPLAGKGEFSDAVAGFLRERGFTVLRMTFSTLLRETCRLLGISTRRENLQLLPQIVNKGFPSVKNNPFTEGVLESFKKAPPGVLQTIANLWGVSQVDTQPPLSQLYTVGFGDGALARAIQHYINSSLEPIIIIDGMRWLEDEELIRGFPVNFVFYITASLEDRFSRKMRGENDGETSMTFEQFKKQHEAPNEIHISTIGSRANLKIVNHNIPGISREEGERHWRTVSRDYALAYTIPLLQEAEVLPSQTEQY